MKILPCPQCKSDDITIYNCGYSSFNPGGGECKKCQFKIDTFVSWNASDNECAKIWNDGVKEARKPKERESAIRKLRKQLRENGLTPVA